MATPQPAPTNQPAFAAWTFVSPQSRADFDSIVSSLQREFPAAAAMERYLLETAANAILRIRQAAAALDHQLATQGYTDLYFRIHRAEARDRTALNAALHQLHKLERRRRDETERQLERIGQLLDRAIETAASAEPEAEREAEPAPPPRNVFERILRELAPFTIPPRVREALEKFAASPPQPQAAAA